MIWVVFYICCIYKTYNWRILIIKSNIHLSVIVYSIKFVLAVSRENSLRPRVWQFGWQMNNYVLKINVNRPVPSVDLWGLHDYSEGEQIKVFLTRWIIQIKYNQKLILATYRFTKCFSCLLNYPIKSEHLRWSEWG